MCCCGPTCCTMCRGLFFKFFYFFLDHIALTCADLVIETMRDKQKAKKQRAHTHTHNINNNNPDLHVRSGGDHAEPMAVMSHCVTGILLKRPFVRFPRSHLYPHSGLRAPPLSHTHTHTSVSHLYEPLSLSWPVCL